MTKDAELEEFLEGLLDGLRNNLSSANVQPSQQGKWSDLDELMEAQVQAPGPHKGASPAYPPSSPSSPSHAVSNTSADPMSTLMRRHALRAFLEETCGTVANAFDLIAGNALRASLGGSGNPEDRLHYVLNLHEFCHGLRVLGYGVNASPSWWQTLFCNIDFDQDGAVSLQDMYDSLVLNASTDSSNEEQSVFFSEPIVRKWQRDVHSALSR